MYRLLSSKLNGRMLCYTKQLSFSSVLFQLPKNLGWSSVWKWRPHVQLCWPIYWLSSMAHLVVTPCLLFPDQSGILWRGGGTGEGAGGGQLEISEKTKWAKMVYQPKPLSTFTSPQGIPFQAHRCELLVRVLPPQNWQGLHPKQLRAVTYVFFIFSFQPCSTIESVEVETAASISISGSMSCRAYMHQKATAGEAVQVQC